MQTKLAPAAEDTVLAWAAAVAARDIGPIMDCYADPLLVFDVVGPLQRKGTPLYRRAWEEEFFPWHGEAGKFELRELSVHSDDRVAFATALLDCGGVEMGQAVEYTLRLTLGLEKIGARWRIVHEHSSEPTPFAARVEA